MNATGSVLVDTNVVVAYFRGEKAGQLKAELAQVGKPIPDNDLWIAALARQYDLPLATVVNLIPTPQFLSVFVPEFTRAVQFPGLPVQFPGALVVNSLNASSACR